MTFFRASLCAVVFGFALSSSAQDPFCLTDPTLATNDIGTAHTVTVTVLDFGFPVVDEEVTIVIASGPNAGISATHTTDAGGEVLFIYTGTNGVGTDVIEASGTYVGEDFICGADKVWAGPQCSMAPLTATNAPGTMHTVTATVVFASGNPVIGESVYFEVVAGPNSGQTAVAATGAGGEAAFSYTGTGGTGTDSIQATGLVLDVGFSCSAQKEWLGAFCTLAPLTATNLPGEIHAVTATVFGTSGVATGELVYFEVTSGPNAGTSTVQTTDSGGQAGFSYQGLGGGGLDTIQATGSVDGFTFDGLASKVWTAPHDLVVTKSDNQAALVDGDTFVYTITVSNLGPGLASAPVLTDTLPASLFFVSSEPGPTQCVENTGTLTCSLDDLVAGAGTTVTIIVLSTTTGTVVNAVQASAAGTDVMLGNNSDIEATTIYPIFCSTDTPVTVVGPGIITSTITVPYQGFEVGDVNIRMVISVPPMTSELIRVASPQGTLIDLLNLQHTASNVFGTGCLPYPDLILDDQAGQNITNAPEPFIGRLRSPGLNLDQFNGEQAGGDWQISVTEDGPGVATIQCWCLELLPVDVKDADGDNASNQDEAIAGTDGFNRDDFLRVKDVTISSPVMVTWSSVVGRVYAVETTSNLVEQVWNTLSNNIAGTGGDLSFTDTNAPMPANATYRLKAGLP